MLKTVCFIVIVIVFASCRVSPNSTGLKKENAQKGKILFENVGCKMCHSVESQKMYGPALNAILNSNIVVIRNGQQKSVKVNRKYLKRSIQDPDYEKEIDYQDHKMPKPELSSDDINLIIDYLIFLNENPDVLND